VHSLTNTAVTICTIKQRYAKEVVKIGQDLAMNGYPQHLIDSVLKRTGVKSQQEIDEICLSTVVIPYVKDASEKFRHTVEQYSIQTVSKTRQTLCSMLTIIRPHREVQDMRHSICSFLVNVVGVTMGKQAIWHMDMGTYEQLKTEADGNIWLANHTYEEGHCIQ
jgi:hypothetical protein